ncbi:MAG: glycerophosphodiester phosphodiesterase [Lachnospiraceae bacterium]|nr:glycerophosphodiester phosphodiesterase [Lachnospiraceae bacterium]
MWIVLLVIVIILGLVCFLVAPGRGCEKTRQDFYHLNLAHRGLHTKDKKVPENSLAAFGRAADAGYGIELDLQLSKDEQIVVFHDDTLNRVCGIDGRVDAYTYEELCNFRLCGTDEKIPLFSEVLELVDGRVPLLVEFKNGPKNNLLCSKTLPMLRAYKGLFCIESFSPFIVQWFRKNAPDILRGQLAGPYSDMKQELPGWQAFLLSNCLLNVIARPHFIAYNVKKTSLTVRLAEAFGAMRAVWTVRPDGDIEGLKKKNEVLIFELYEPEIRF